MEGLYGWVVFVHAAAILLFFILHGTSMAVAFRVQSERDPERLRALLDLSRATLGVPAVTLVLIGLGTGIIAAFMHSLWGELWVWTSLVLFLLVGVSMTPMVTFRLNAIRVAAGQANPRRPTEAPPVENPDELRRLQAAWNPYPVAIIGIVAFLVILYLMIVKPF